MKRKSGRFVRGFALAAVGLLLFHLGGTPLARAYVRDFTVPAAGGCPQPQHQDIAVGAAPLARQWSTSLPNINPSSIVTVATQGTPAQLNEIEGTIQQAYAAWAGVSGTLVNASSFPNALGPLGRTTVQNACSPDPVNGVQTGVDGVNTICFNQTSAAFTTGVLSFTRIMVADAPSQVFGSAPPSIFAGQIVDADICFRNDGQATFATPGALATAPGAYDLESLLAHELGHVFGLDHSGVWRAIMFPFAPSPGTFFGDRPTVSTPDAPLADDDRAGLRSLYPDPADTTDVGFISGRILPANPFALADFPATSPGEYVTGIFGAQVVAVDAATGSVVSATLGGWTCDAANPPPQFDGSYTLGPLPIGRSYIVYAEPFVGLVQPADMAGAATGACGTGASPSCTVPAINTSFAPRLRP
ncbi:MAG TPA: matrixin family metalloprotease [Candidatus Acidoferrales bacterium]|nr:matrixin family metalloprotease [Candidatus Acidoferrales bacterium]